MGRDILQMERQRDSRWEEEQHVEQKEKVDEEVGHLQLLKRDKPLKCLSVN